MTFITLRTMMGLIVTDLELRFGERVLFSNVNLNVPDGFSLAVMGPSGTGKSTLLQAIMGDHAPHRGNIDLNGKSIPSMSRDDIYSLRRNSTGVVMQDPMFLPELNILDNVALPLILMNRSVKEARPIAQNILEHLNLQDLAYRNIHQVSGGQLQRCSIARALIKKDLQIIIADEPTASLDKENVKTIAAELVFFARTRNIPIIISTHDEMVAQHCDAVLHLDDAIYGAETC